MTDNQEENNKPKKLTLSSSKLTLNRSITPTLGRSFVSGRSNTVTVEVKKGVASSTTSLTRKLTSSEEELNLSSDEVTKRLTVLKKAAELNKAKEQEIIFKAENAKIIAEQNNILSSAVKLEEPQLSDKKHNIIENTEKPSPSSAVTIKPAINNIKPHSAKAVALVEEEESEAKKALDAKVPVKLKKEEPKKLRKNEIFHMLESDEDTPGKTRSLASIKRAREKERRKFFENKSTEKIYREVVIPEVITVSELASRMSERVADVIKELMKMGMIATANQAIDPDTAELIVSTMGHTPKRVQESDVENIFDIQADNEEALKSRAPVVTVMGHVDHGKTSLLDALKSTDVAGGEAGGITQHIGAYRVTLPSGQSITFLDTPGHEAFTEMRSRGAKVTDIVVLVVAADDGIMPQTIEAINHAKAAEVPIIVAINKMDKPDANLERVKNELLMHELVPEELGGDIIVVPVSALKKQNLDKLEEAILLVAEMKELKANPQATASGAVIESKVDKGRGVIASVLVQRGSLKVGDLVVAGESYGKVKRMLDDHGKNVEVATPSMPVEIQGLDQAPMAGEKFAVVQSEKQARDITEYRARKALEKRTIASQQTSSLEEMFLRASGNSGIKTLPLIIKGDVQGSIEAIAGSLAKIVSEEVKVKILHTAVGGITESDAALASASNAMIVGFNVRASNNAALAAEKAGVDIRYYSIIYNLIDDIKSIMSGMLSPIIREVYIGSVEIRQVFNITKVGKVAGSYVTKGTIKRGAGVRLLRDNIVIHEGKLKTLKRFKDDVKEVKENYECGIAFENYEDIRVGDIVEVFEIVEEQQKL